VLKRDARAAETAHTIDKETAASHQNGKGAAIVEGICVKALSPGHFQKN
jgi:hypothetical protein